MSTLLWSKFYIRFCENHLSIRNYWGVGLQMNKKCSDFANITSNYYCGENRL